MTNERDFIVTDAVISDPRLRKLWDGFCADSDYPEEQAFILALNARLEAAERMASAVDRFMEAYPTEHIEDHGYQEEWNGMNEARFAYRSTQQESQNGDSQ